MKAEYKRK